MIRKKDLEAKSWNFRLIIIALNLTLVASIKYSLYKCIIFVLVHLDLLVLFQVVSKRLAIFLFPGWSLTLHLSHAVFYSHILYLRLLRPILSNHLLPRFPKHFFKWLALNSLLHLLDLLLSQWFFNYSFWRGGEHEHILRSISGFFLLRVYK